MSLMKRWAEDAALVSTLALTAASVLDDTERFTALRSVFQEAGLLANSYHCPMTAARALVSTAVENYQSARRHAGRQFESRM